MNVAIIPARGGSKRLPRKNIQPFAGKPLIAHSIQIARDSGIFSEIWVTSDDPEICAVATDFGARAYVRRPELAQDHVGPEPVVQDIMHTALGGKDFAFACMIYATAPLMQPQDLARGLNELMVNPNAPYTYSAALKPQRDHDLRWDAGQWYWGRRRSWSQCIPIDNPDSLKVVIPEERVCDINTQADLERCERLYQAMKVPA